MFIDRNDSFYELRRSDMYYDAPPELGTNPYLIAINITLLRSCISKLCVSLRSCKVFLTL